MKQEIATLPNTKYHHAAPHPSKKFIASYSDGIYRATIREHQNKLQLYLEFKVKSGYQIMINDHQWKTHKVEKSIKHQISRRTVVSRGQGK